MNESSTISTYLKTETDEIKEHCSTNFLTQRKKVPQLKNLIRSRQSKQFKFSPLLDTVASNRSHRSSKGNLAPNSSTSLQFKDTFDLFLDGKISSIELLQLSNYPRLRAQLLDEHSDNLGISILGPLLRFKKKIRNSKAKLSVDDRQLQLKQKLQSLNSLISTRVNQKKEYNDVQRRQNLQSVGLLKTIVNASEGVQEQLNKKDEYQKSIPTLKPLKTITVSYDDLKPIIKYNKELEEVSNAYLKNNLNEQTQKFMEEVAKQQNAKEDELHKVSKIQITKQPKKKFELFNKGVLTAKDLELYDYLHNKPKPLILKNHFTEIEENDDSPNYITKIGNQRIRKRHYENKPQIFDDLEDVSHTSSLQSTYEIRLDNLYSQTVDLKKQLPKKTTLPKKVKQMIRLDELHQQSLQTNIFKLKH